MSLPVITDDTVKSLLNAGAALTEPITSKHETDFIVVPAGYTAQATEKLIEPYLKLPRRVKGSARFQDLESFIAYVLAFKTEDSRLFYDRGDGSKAPPEILAVLDYHHDSQTAAWKEHTATYRPLYTEEWTRFVEKDGERMTQEPFLEFIEENTEVIIDPPGAELLEVAMSLEGKNNITCNQLLRLDNGKTKLVYSEDVELRGQPSGRKEGEVLFPNIITLGIIPFENGPGYRFKARLRYRIENRKLFFWFEIVDLHLVVKQAVNSIIATIKEKLSITPLFGKP